MPPNQRLIVVVSENQPRVWHRSFLRCAQREKAQGSAGSQRKRRHQHVAACHGRGMETSACSPPRGRGPRSGPFRSSSTDYNPGVLLLDSMNSPTLRVEQVDRRKSHSLSIAALVG
jgi:hypothetical protein